MSEVAAVAIIALAGLFLVGALAFVGFILKVLFWAVFFPIRLVLKLTLGLAGLALGAVLLPLLLLAAGIAVVVALVAGVIALVTPLLPVILLLLVGWAIYRVSVGRPSPVI